jgi:predicted N-acetyltransferase YhbS
VIVIRPYLSSDVDDAFALYEQTCAVPWPLSRADFASQLLGGLVALDEGRLVGFCAYVNRRGRAALHFLAVEPATRRRGVGSALHSAMLVAVQDSGVSTIALGGSPGPCLWPGLPDDLDDSPCDFLAARGWEFDGACYDLTGELADCPAADVAGYSMLSYRLADKQDRQALSTFERQHFPSWADYFALARPERVLLALEADTIVGSLLIGDSDGPLLWRELLGPLCGTIGCVGVAAAHEGQGIGSGLVSAATAELRAAGATSCYLAWVYRTNFYGRLGFHPWRHYQTANLPLTPG